MRRLCIYILVSLGIVISSEAQLSLKKQTPFVGAEVFIEPGQTPEEIDYWFRVLKDKGMDYCRIRMFESYMHKPDGSWDYSLFDLAFRSAEKYGIGIFGSIFPATSFSDLGGIKFPSSEEHLQSIKVFLENLVNHFKTFPSLYAWVLINEPGTGGSIPNNEFSFRKMAEWKKNKKQGPYDSNGFNTLDFTADRFLLDYNTWFLHWIAEEIVRYDPGRPLHVNNHQIFQNAAEYDFPAWRSFLSSLGGSAHPSWHFGYFNRQQYAVAMSANSEMIKSGAGNIPWLMTELQGGNNTYSGGIPMCPTSQEIGQWLWLNVATGSKGSIFWCLNPRASGFESGEWALLDFQGNPSERMEAASEIAFVLKKNADLFSAAIPCESGINILYTRESLWVEKKMHAGGEGYEGRSQGAVMKSALGYFEALGEMGLQSNLKEIAEFDFSEEDYTGKAIILAHQISVASAYWPKLEAFVAKGGRLLVDGLTAYYDENAFCIAQGNFPLGKLFGGQIKEFKAIDSTFMVRLNSPAIDLPSLGWRGVIHLTTGQQAGRYGNEIIAARNKFGKGEVFWIPSLLGLAARSKGDYTSLCRLLERELTATIEVAPLHFTRPQKKMLIKTMQSGNKYISVIINKSGAARSVSLTGIGQNRAGAVLFGKMPLKEVRADNLYIGPEETLVLEWKEPGTDQYKINQVQNEKF